MCPSTTDDTFSSSPALSGLMSPLAKRRTELSGATATPGSALSRLISESAMPSSSAWSPLEPPSGWNGKTATDFGGAPDSTVRAAAAADSGCASPMNR